MTIYPRCEVSAIIAERDWLVIDIVTGELQCSDHDKHDPNI